jgi:pimeloyl-ACP methyl ester carboxylesterase
MSPTPFHLEVHEDVIADLRERLARTRFPDQAPGEPWAYGTPVDYLRDLVIYWGQSFDWRAAQARLNAFPQYKVPLAGIDLHFLHVPGKGPRAFPLLLSHGWPGSVLEFQKIIPLLTDPGSHGGDPADAFTVVAPSLPGYGLSFRPGQKRFALEEIADCFATLMTEVLGYPRFAAQGGDWGAFVTSRLGHAYPDRLVGIHLNLLAVRRDPKMVASPTPEEAGTRALPEGEHRLSVDPGHAPPDAGRRPDRFARRAGRLDRGEVPRLVRLRWRRRIRVQPRRVAGQHNVVLGDGSDRLVILALLCPHARPLAHPRGRGPGAHRLLPVPVRDPATAAFRGGAVVP